MRKIRSFSIINAAAIIFPVSVAICSLPVIAENVEIKVSIKAVCSLSVDSLIDLEEIPVTAFSGKSAAEEISGYDKTFVVQTSCAGASKYALTFTPVKSSGGCLVATSEEMGFCLYDSGGRKIALAATGTTLQKAMKTDGEIIKVVPVRVTKAPTAGEHSGTLTVTIAPL